MIPRKSRIFLVATLAGVSLGLAASAGAQGLALSYALSVVPDSTPPAPVTTSRCAGVTWIASLGACSWDLLARISPARRVGGDGHPPADVPPAVEPVVLRAALPTLGNPGPASIARSGGGNDSPAGSSKAVDPSLRFSAANNARHSDGGREWSRFSDIAQEGRRQSSLPKVVGVELLVPFQ